jgi:poly-beta-1,6-N-acetyl-D-glucosamine synthase
MAHVKYGLVTAAYNEEACIELTIRSIVAQSHLPEFWEIVSDGSTDRTDEIVQGYARLFPCIHLLRLTTEHNRNFAAQVNAINAGLEFVKDRDCDYIGNLDADVTLEQDYFEKLLALFQSKARLGLGGGFIHDKNSDGSFTNRRTNTHRSVAHAVQLFRRECFEAIGGAYVPLPYGGPDSYAETMARMQGWDVQAFPSLKVLHHRPSGSAGGMLRGCFRMGRMDYSLGYSPAYEFAKVVRRLPERPFVTGCLARTAGFLYGYCRREHRPVAGDFMAFLRTEQKARIRSLFGFAADHGGESGPDRSRP